MPFRTTSVKEVSDMTRLFVANQGSDLKPLLRWAGGKRWLVPKIREIWEQYAADHRLVEPFGGGLAIALGLRPERALLNDINPHLINFYNQVKAGLELKLRVTVNQATYTELRTHFNTLIKTGNAQTAEAAELFYFLNRSGYNGVCRFNKDGEFNVPFGHNTKIKYFIPFTEHQKQFTNWTFACEDFAKLELKKDDFVYADPPYDAGFTMYSKEDFQWEDHERLVNWLSKHTGPIILSNLATDRVVDLYEKNGYELRYQDVQRMVSCDGKKRLRAREVIAFKNIQTPQFN